MYDVSRVHVLKSPQYLVQEKLVVVFVKLLFALKNLSEVGVHQF